MSQLKRYGAKIVYVTFLASMLYTYGAILGGCGAGAIGAHAAAADAVRGLNNTTVDLIETTCRNKALDAARDPSVTTDEAEANARAVAETCHTIENAQHTFAAAHDTWVSFLLKAIADDEFQDQASIRLLVDVVRLYGELVPLAADFGIELPELPPLVTQLLGGGS